MNSFLCKKLDRFADKGILLVRVVFGISIAAHGYPKVMGGAEKWEMVGSVVFGNLPMGLTVAAGAIAAFSEFLGGILLAIGLFTRIACIFLACTMLGALSYHLMSGDPFGKYSHALEVLVVFLMFLFTGAKTCSLDEKLGRN